MKTLTGGTLLITGGTGSFGHAVLRRFLDAGLAEIRIFSRDEQKQEDMRRAFGNGHIRYLIGDVRDPDSVREATRGVDLIFHAAALKQVPSCEFYPLEAIKTNVIGTENLLQAAIDNGVARVVLLSTDKAVYPVNAMGLTKALAEKVMVAKARSADPTRTVLAATRYGNVVASRGSVVPLFLDQLRAGTVLTITDPTMTRFMMTLEESVDLVMHAFQDAEPGDIFVRRSPSATIGDIAAALRAMAKHDPGERVIGTRAGEKRHETIVSREEAARAQHTGAFVRIPADGTNLDYTRFTSTGRPEIGAAVDLTSENSTRLDMAALHKLFASVPAIMDALAC